MPLMEFEVQIETAKFYKNRTEIMKDTILDSRVSIR
jgi:hypothetical protein